MKHPDHLREAPAEPDPTTPDPVAYLRDWITWARARVLAQRRPHSPP